MCHSVPWENKTILVIWKNWPAIYVGFFLDSFWPLEGVQILLKSMDFGHMSPLKDLQHFFLLSYTPPEYLIWKLSQITFNITWLKSYFYGGRGQNHVILTNEIHMKSLPREGHVSVFSSYMLLMTNLSAFN